MLISVRATPSLEGYIFTVSRDDRVLFTLNHRAYRFRRAQGDGRRETCRADGGGYGMGSRAATFVGFCWGRGNEAANERFAVTSRYPAAW
jgi:hypothetical protein